MIPTITTREENSNLCINHHPMIIIIIFIIISSIRQDTICTRAARIVKNGPMQIPASFWFFSSVVHVTILISIDKSVDSMLGIRTWGSKMEGANKSTELWGHPSSRNCLINKLAQFFGQGSSVDEQQDRPNSQTCTERLECIIMVCHIHNSLPLGPMQAFISFYQRAS